MCQLIGEVQLADDLGTSSWWELLFLRDDPEFFGELLGFVKYDSLRRRPIEEVNENLCTQEDHLSHMISCFIRVAGRSNQ